jgi:hypothetical protein
MALSYSPNEFKGSHYAEIFAETLQNAETFAKGYVAIMANVKTEQFVTTASGSITEQDYVANVDITSANGGMSLSDVKVMPIKKMFLTTVNPEELRFTRFGDSKMGAGARNLNISEFENLMLDHLVPQMSKSIEDAFWASIISKAQAADTIKIAKDIDGLSTSNIVAEVEKVWTAIPAPVRATGNAVIYADYSVKDLIVLANLHDNYKDRFVVNGDSVKFLGVDLLFVPLGGHTMFAGNKNEVVFATDVLNDEASIEIGKVNNYSDILFYKSVYTRDTAIVVPTQKVLYI